MKKFMMIFISIVPLFFLYGNNNIIVFSMSDNPQDAKIKAEELQKKIEHSRIINYKSNNKPKIGTIKVDDRWLLVSQIDDKNSVDKIGIIAKDKYPSTLIIKDSKKNEPKKTDIKKISVEKSNITIEWSMLILIGIIGIFSIIWLLRKISKIKDIQNELEQKQMNLMNKILKSEHYV